MVAISFFCSNRLFAQQAANVTSYSGVSCACGGSQTVCSANTFFMSCCICCEAGRSCGAWSAFGICSCACESTSATVVIFHDAFVEFLSALASKGASTKSITADYQNLISGALSKFTIDQNEKYFILDPSKAKQFAERTKNTMMDLVRDQNISTFVQQYLTKSLRR
jgi:hypothetical protein